MKDKISEEDFAELKSVGDEMEKFRVNMDKNCNISTIFTHNNWKLAQITFSDMGEQLTVGIFAAVEPTKNLFYNSQIFCGRDTNFWGEKIIKYKILTQESYEELFNKSVKIKYSVYNFKDC